jgi:hypothetical protein
MTLTAFLTIPFNDLMKLDEGVDVEVKVRGWSQS